MTASLGQQGPPGATGPAGSPGSSPFVNVAQLASSPPDWGSVINTSITGGERHFQFPRGAYTFTTPLNSGGASGVVIEGSGGYSHPNGIAAANATVLIFDFAGTTSDFCISTGADAFQIRDCVVLYKNDNFFGNIIDTSGSWGQGARPVFERCYIGAYRIWPGQSGSSPAALGEATWSSATTYAAGAIVKKSGPWGSNYSYKSLQNGNLNHTPPAPTVTNDAWWLPWVPSARSGIDFEGSVGAHADDCYMGDCKNGLVTTVAGLCDDFKADNLIMANCTDYFIRGPVRDGSFKNITMFGNGFGRVWQPPSFIGWPATDDHGTFSLNTSFEDIQCWDLANPSDIGYISYLFDVPANAAWNLKIKRTFIFGSMAWNLSGSGAVRLEDVTLGGFGYDAGVLYPLGQLELGNTNPAAFSSATTYKKGDIAIGSGNNWYVSLQNGNLNHTPTFQAIDAWWAWIRAGTVKKQLTFDNVSSGVTDNNYTSGSRPMTNLNGHTINRLKWAHGGLTYERNISTEVIPPRRRIQWLAKAQNDAMAGTLGTNVTGASVRGNGSAGVLQLNIGGAISAGKLCEMTFPVPWEENFGDDESDYSGYATAKGAVVIITPSSHPDIQGAVDIAKTYGLQAYAVTHQPVAGSGVVKWELWAAGSSAGSFLAEWTFDVKSL